VRVPDDMSVVGHDDTALAETVTPRLTTVRIPAAAAGAAAARMLVRHLVGRLGNDDADRRTVLSAELIVRASTGPAPHRRDTGRASSA
jgi:DNA-binding LacI/PurR family transcriptional regulator